MNQPELLEPKPDSTGVSAMSLPARLANVYASPGEVFDSVKASPPSAWNWLAPALAFIFLSWLGAALVFSQPAIKQQLSDITDKAIDKQIQKAHLSEQEAEKRREIGAKYAGTFQKMGAAVGPVFAGFISPFLWGLFIWLAGAKAMKGSFPYMKAVEVVGLSNMVGALEVILKTLLIVILGDLYASPSLSLFVKDFNPENPVHSLLFAANAMTFWLLLVRAIGLSRLTSSSLSKACAWVFGIWLTYTGLFWGLGVGLRAAFSR